MLARVTNGVALTPPSVRTIVHLHNPQIRLMPSTMDISEYEDTVVRGLLSTPNEPICNNALLAFRRVFQTSVKTAD
ncbi:hypothetical protein EON63_02000 [archaeon]|nr:MAG: hypothetical protein EON63_02000 [archaeon]